MNYYSEKIFLYVLFKNIPTGKPPHSGFPTMYARLRPQSRNIEFIKLKLLWKTHIPSKPCCYAMQRTTTDTDRHRAPRIRNRNTKYLFSSDDHSGRRYCFTTVYKH